ncbi:MAG: hypothetical protein SGPRY_013238 [Prymnesium sp.]
MKIFLRAVSAVRATTPDGFAALKVTALGNPRLLERVSNAIIALRDFYRDLGNGQGKLTRDGFISGWTAAFDVTEKEAAAQFNRFDGNQDGLLDALEFTNSLPLEEVARLVLKCRRKGPLYASVLSKAEFEAFANMSRRLDQIGEFAYKLVRGGCVVQHLPWSLITFFYQVNFLNRILSFIRKEVRLMVDAEHTYFQPCIDHAVLQLQRKYNKDYPAIFGTYQAYLRDCNSRLQIDLERARREGFHLGAKLVRGAYMSHERERARARDYPDPIHPTVEQTHASCAPLLSHRASHRAEPRFSSADEQAVDALMAGGERVSIVLATHNQRSIERAVEQIIRSDSAVSPLHKQARFIVLSRLIPFSAATGFKAYKYVPYGPENSDALSGASQQRTMMLRELRRRLIGF